jgi:cell division protein FtsN
MRDYRKGATRRARPSASFSGWTGVAIGLGIGLVIAAGVWQYKSRPPAEQSAAKQKKPIPASQAEDPVEKPPGDPGMPLNFPKMLQNTEVPIAEKEKDVHHDVHAPAVTRPGTYYLQAGAFRSEAEADHVRAKLALSGIESKIQRVSNDADVLHRVRIGPYTDLDALNRVRTRLRQANIDADLISVGGE